MAPLGSGDVTVELYIGGAWVDVTSYVMHAGQDRVEIFRGVHRAIPGTVLASPGECRLTLRDVDRTGRWSNRVPGSTYYRQLGRNTPLRVTVAGSVRGVWEVGAWEPRWDVAEKMVVVPVEAAGILRRLSRGAQSLRSPVYRDIMSPANTMYRVAYWPIEDGSDANAAVSPMAGVAPMAVSGTVRFSAYDSPGSEPLATLTAGASLAAVPPVYTPLDDEHKVVQLWAFPSTPLADSTVIARYHFAGTSTVARYDLIYRTAFSGALRISAYDSNGTLIQTFGDLVFGGLDGGHFLTSTEWNPSGGNTLTRVLAQRINVAAPANSTSYSTTFTGIDVSTARISRIELFPGGNGDGVSVGHLVLVNDISGAAALGDAIVGHATETAGRRIERLCDEEGIAFTGVGDLDDTGECGPQTVDTLLANLEAAAGADQGLLYETRTELGLSYRTRVNLYDQPAKLVIDYSARYVSPPLAPTEDDMTVWNDVSVSRPDGSTARSVLETATDPQHTLTIEAPPDGVGTYDRGTLVAHVQTDDQAALLAAWLRHIGTWDELRYPTLTVELASSAWTADATSTSALVALNVGDWFRLDNLPAWLPPGDVPLMWHGCTEIVDPPTWTFRISSPPALPWEVWQLDTGGSTLAVAASAAATSLKLATSTGPGWSTTAEPYHIQISGEAMTVTAMTTDTPAYIGVGVDAHADNASVTPALPGGITADAGQLLVMVAAIRNSGTGVPNTPTGWSRLPVFGASDNVQVFGRYYVTGVTAPTVSFTGGVAGATCSAQIAAFSGLSMHLDDGPYHSSLPSPQVLLNSSQQNIPFLALETRRTNAVTIWVGWKQDDWTSAGGLFAGTVEIAEASTVVGDDQALVWDYKIQTAAETYASGSWTITGGVSAISRGAAFALRPLQTATVTRSVNGASTALAAGAAVNGWRLGVLAL